MGGEKRKVDRELSTFLLLAVGQRYLLLIREDLNDILDPALYEITDIIRCRHADGFVVAQAVQEGGTETVFLDKCILRDVLTFERCPEPVV